MTVRVMHVLEALEGGTSRHLVDVVRHVPSAQHTVVIPPRRVGGLTDEAARDLLLEAGARVLLLDMHRTPWAPANARALWRLRRVLDDERPDVIHAHSSIGGLLARVASWGTRTPTIYTPNGITQVRAGIAVERLLRPRTAAFVAVSESEGELALDLGLIDRGRLSVIPNGIELDLPVAPLDLRAHLGLDPDTPLVGTIARLVHQKAPGDFVAACALVASAVPQARFAMVGSGDLEAEVDAAVEAAGLQDRFFRLTSLPGAAGILGQLDVFALSSRFEGGPYSPLEAMRAGTAVVLTDVVGSKDAVEHGVTGLIVPAGDTDAMAEAITRLLLDRPLRIAMGEAGQARVAELFDVRGMGRALERLYAELVSR